MVALGSTAGVAVYYMDSENQHRVLWLIGAGVFFTIWPWTLLVMVPDIKENLKDDVFETKGKFIPAPTKRRQKVHSLVFLF